MFAASRIAENGAAAKMRAVRIALRSPKATVPLRLPRQGPIAASAAALYPVRMTPPAAFSRSALSARTLRAVLGGLLLLLLVWAPGTVRLSVGESPFFAAKAAQYLALPAEFRLLRPEKAARPTPSMPLAGGRSSEAPPGPAAAFWLADWTDAPFRELPATHPVRPASQAPPLTA